MSVYWSSDARGRRAASASTGNVHQQNRGFVRPLSFRTHVRRRWLTAHSHVRGITTAAMLISRNQHH